MFGSSGFGKIGFGSNKPATPAGPIVYVYRGASTWAAKYKGVNSDAVIYKGVRTLHP